MEKGATSSYCSSDKMEVAVALILSLIHEEVYFDVLDPTDSRWIFIFMLGIPINQLFFSYYEYMAVVVKIVPAFMISCETLLQAWSI